MRKYNSRTKKTIMIVLILCVGIIIIFSLFLKKAIDVGKNVYQVDSGSILFDKYENMITVKESSTLRIKWGGDYYLTMNDENYDLGSHAIIYNSNSGDISLYGKFYEVKKSGKVDTVKGENKIKSSVNSRFYKLADRLYLIIDRTIESNDSSFVTSNYLIVHLDKMGNATLLNNKTSYKTIVPSILRTSSYTFDIANEKLNFGAEDIDLKKIIGSTNQFDKDTYNLNFTVTGAYARIAEFITDIEDDSSLGFKIEEFKMLADSSSDTSTLQATFACKDVKIEGVSSTTSTTTQTETTSQNNNTVDNTTTNTTTNTTK